MLLSRRKLFNDERFQEITEISFEIAFELRVLFFTMGDDLIRVFTKDFLICIHEKPVTELPHIIFNQDGVSILI